MANYESNTRKPSSRQLIVDEFTDLPISRQRKWQLRHKKQGKCHICPAKMYRDSGYCLDHLKAHRELARKAVGAKKSYKNTKFAEAYA